MDKDIEDVTQPSTMPISLDAPQSSDFPTTNKNHDTLEHTSRLNSPAPKNHVDPPALPGKQG